MSVPLPAAAASLPTASGCASWRSAAVLWTGITSAPNARILECAGRAPALSASMRVAASATDRLEMLCDRSTRYTTDIREDPVEMTGRASARASAASSADRTPACSIC
jgi:hypothetical protein